MTSLATTVRTGVTVCDFLPLVFELALPGIVFPAAAIPFLPAPAPPPAPLVPIPVPPFAFPAPAPDVPLPAAASLEVLLPGLAVPPFPAPLPPAPPPAPPPAIEFAGGIIPGIPEALFFEEPIILTAINVSIKITPTIT